MTPTEKKKLRKAAAEAQAKFERDRAAAREDRRRAFEAIEKAGLSQREIGEAAGIHHTRVGRIIRGEN